MTDSRRPRLAVSRCLLGEPVRYDGGHQRHLIVADVMAPHVDWAPVCPEVALGMGTPRPTIDLVPGPRLVAQHGGRDWTAPMQTFARAWRASVRTLDGAVLKAGSPSCALTDASRIGGPGLFTRTIADELPLIDEVGLEDATRRVAFAWRVEVGKRSPAAEITLLLEALGGDLRRPLTRRGEVRALTSALETIAARLEPEALRKLRVELAALVRGGGSVSHTRDAIAAAARQVGADALVRQRYLRPGPLVRAMESVR